MERCELIRTVAVLVALAVALVAAGREPLGDLIRAVRGRLQRKGGELGMYNWVVPPELLTGLVENREHTAIPIARQIREAVEAYLSRVEARAAAGPEPLEQSERGGVSS